MVHGPNTVGVGTFKRGTRSAVTTSFGLAERRTGFLGNLTALKPVLVVRSTRGLEGRPVSFDESPNAASICHVSVSGQTSHSS
jgi:hypothetical protein